MQWLAQVHYKEALQGVRLVAYGGGVLRIHLRQTTMALPIGSSQARVIMLLKAGRCDAVLNRMYSHLWGTESHSWRHQPVTRGLMGSVT
jgi:hypothetical protein